MDRSLGSTKEYTVKLCTDPTSRTHIMRFPMPGGLDLASLENPRLERQLPAGVVRDDNAPEFGAGTEYGQKEREEARRRRRSAYRRRVPTADDFPWLLRSGKKKEKSKYTGRKEGGIQQSASYYLFREVDSDTFEAVPVSSWYNFTPNINYDTLTAEEAEQQFEKRHKTLNYHAVMVQKRLQGTAEGEDSQLSGEAATAGAATGGRSLKTLMGDGLQVREDEEWAMSDSDSDGSGNEGNSKPSKKKPARKTKKKQSRGSDESEPNDEESDDPDVEQSKEVDYISDGTSEEENTGGYAADEEPKLAKKKEQVREFVTVMCRHIVVVIVSTAFLYSCIRLHFTCLSFWVQYNCLGLPVSGYRLHFKWSDFNTVLISRLSRRCYKGYCFSWVSPHSYFPSTCQTPARTARNH